MKLPLSPLPCAECTKTNNHCCKADIPLDIVDAVHMKWLITEKYKLADKVDIVVALHPVTNLREQNKFFVINQKDIIAGSSVDIREHNCSAFIDGKCGIYEDRPNICRQYGTAFMKCRFECAGITSSSQIAALDSNSIKELDMFAAQDSEVKLVELVDEPVNN